MIRLKCIKVGILTPGYFTDANCQFPRELRVEDRLYDTSRCN